MSFADFSLSRFHSGSLLGLSKNSRINELVIGANAIFGTLFISAQTLLHSALISYPLVYQLHVCYKNFFSTYFRNLSGKPSTASLTLLVTIKRCCYYLLVTFLVTIKRCCNETYRLSRLTLSRAPPNSIFLQTDTNSTEPNLQPLT